jgi:hypothetical protein
MVEWVFLAGVPVQASLVLTLAELVRDVSLAEKLERAVNRDLIVIGLDDDERVAVLKALADPPPGLEEVRDTLLEEQDRRAPLVAQRSAAGTAA